MIGMDREQLESKWREQELEERRKANRMDLLFLIFMLLILAFGAGLAVYSGAHKKMTSENFVKAQLVALAHREAAHCGGRDNMLAVAFVVRNRQRAGWHGGDWLSIIAHHDVYSASVRDPSIVPIMDLRDTNLRLVIQQIDDVFSGMMVDEFTSGALYYAELNQVDRDWFRRNVLAMPLEHPRVAHVGSMAFFA